MKGNSSSISPQCSTSFPKWFIVGLLVQISLLAKCLLPTPPKNKNTLAVDCMVFLFKMSKSFLGFPENKKPRHYPVEYPN